MRGKIKVMLLICSALLMLGCANPVLTYVEHLEQGRTYGDQQQWDEAIVQYTKAIELDPELAEAYNNRGIAYGQKGESDNAIADFDKVIELDPERVEAYNLRGIAYKNKGISENEYHKINPAPIIAYHL